MATVIEGNAIVSGVWTPTLTNTTNVAASTAYECQYIRVGRIVMFSGRVDVDPTAAGPTATQLTMTIPISSTFGATEDCGGTAHCNIIAQGAAIRAIVGDTKIMMEYSATDATNRSFFFSGMYQII